ncbi:protein phosphatase regulator [Paecilomyces lecythidis]|uniref:Protein phosphatase regulator n=1 Tax=Paecilomyces lecythidis TaxID=3004212 RepID=A0ABR3Y663_9EURO
MTAVLLAPGRSPGDVRYCHTDLRHPSAEDLLDAQDVFLSSSPRDYAGYSEISRPPSVSTYAPSASTSSTYAAYSPSVTPNSSLSPSDDSVDDDIVFPSYDDDYSFESTVRTNISGVKSANPSPEAHSGASTPDSPQPTAKSASDDMAIEDEPSRHVDYLSHEWREEDIWSSWRYVISRRNMYANAVRLENASWRTWAKAKYKLRTVSPETLNWLKDCDVTWLYGPLQTENKQPTVSSTGSRVGTPTSFKSILKKKTASETILQRSLSQHVLLKHAGAILKAREEETNRGRPSFERSTSDMGVAGTPGIDSAFGSMDSTPTNTTSSGLTSPGERRHIHFNNEVVQCIAVEAKGADDDFDCWSHRYDQDDESDDDGLVIMKRFPSRPPIARKKTPTPRSPSNESKTIAPLPPTTLKYRGDTPEPPSSGVPTGLTESPKLTQTPSVETLRPPTSQTNFLLDEEDDLDMHWQPRQSIYAPGPDRPWFVNPEDEESENGCELHLTPSGMFMPYEDADGSSSGLFGRVINTVNTARDIAHVIWNVGWRR